MRNRGATITALIAGLALLGCDDGDDNGDGDSGDAAPGAGGVATTYQAACEAVAASQCRRLLECNLTFTDLELCTSTAANRCCEGRCDDPVPSAEQEAWSDCRSEIDAATCDAVQQVQPACQPLTTAL